jgi:hypothetical protein
MPLISRLAWVHVPWNYVLTFLMVCSVPSVVVIPLLILWQAAFLLHAYMQEDAEVIKTEVLLWHLGAFLVSALVWMYGMPFI